VGTNDPAQAEAINQLPVVISAALNGIDKRMQGGYDWALMCEEFFNNRPAENVYLNGSSSQSGSDWWYDVMPNVFFYQLNWLYPRTGDFDRQFRIVADRWLAAVSAMGGSTAPWRRPSMNYRGWYLATMSPNTAGVPEPESAGSIAWLLYQAYGVTHDERYRIGAEWAMEYMNSLNSNPSYELQLTYGTYAAARMNAELGTSYDVNKMMQWCFDVGPLRSWGAITGTWGGLDVSGLIGEVNGTNDYAFAMNTFQQAGALVPLVRYDDRFARAVGKWMLNAANASRLFYSKYLPEGNQDAASWASRYDTSGAIAYEALRQSSSGATPYATGDAVRGGWAKTNLSLYSSSSAGILGAIVETTNVEKILRLDLLATDYYHASAYPSFLVYNPYDVPKKILFDAGAGTHDIYDAVANSFASTNVSGVIELTIPADLACVFVVVPSGGMLSYTGNKTLCNGIVIDYSSGLLLNVSPRIKACSPDTTVVAKLNSIHIYCAAEDQNSGDTLTYEWSASAGKLLGEGAQVLWNAPDTTGICTVRCRVSDGKGGADTAVVTLTVVDSLSAIPVINSIGAESQKIALGASTALHCDASAGGGSLVRYTWSATAGVIDSSGATVRWIAPMQEGDYVVRCIVSNRTGGQAKDSITILVRDLAAMTVGVPVAYYPLDGDGIDRSGNGNDGTLRGTHSATDRFGIPGGAMGFDGVSDAVLVPNAALLNFQNAITVNFWMNVGIIYERESYPVSHGSWENRWKVSVSNGKARWTVKTSAGIRDVDSKSNLKPGVWYNITGCYDGWDAELYVNGVLVAFAPLTGPIGVSPVGFTIGQVLPSNAAYNFNGTLDELRIYDHPLPPDAIKALAASPTSIVHEPPTLPTSFAVSQNFPNPFNGETTIRIDLPNSEEVTISIFTILGERIEELHRGRMDAGRYTLRWTGSAYASGVYFYCVRAGAFVTTKRMQLCK
ncbi:MAG TPA: LamG-like jellyroll fold domain-containing protein, partial [Bacteroidota bacterium]|nr:LamG-like jellyroll fold domain-containing protein [Bacteroidota bacterium]